MTEQRQERKKYSDGHATHFVAANKEEQPTNTEACTTETGPAGGIRAEDQRVEKRECTPSKHALRVPTRAAWCPRGRYCVLKKLVELIPPAYQNPL